MTYNIKMFAVGVAQQDRQIEIPLEDPTVVDKVKEIKKKQEERARAKVWLMRTKVEQERVIRAAQCAVAFDALVNPALREANFIDRKVKQEQKKLAQLQDHLAELKKAKQQLLETTH